MANADETLRELLRAHIDDHDLIANLGAFGRRMHFMKAFCHYEVFKLVRDLPGDIVECGVYKGASLLSFARFMETFCSGDRTRKVLGFDHFKGLADRNAKDGFDERVGNTADGWNPAAFRDTLFGLVDAFNADSFVPQRARVELVDGDVRETAPQFVADNPGLRVSLLHLDMDLYEPTSPPCAPSGRASSPAASCCWTRSPSASGPARPRRWKSSSTASLPASRSSGGPRRPAATS